jgi:Flp pilus assembly pilin Flp
VGLIAAVCIGAMAFIGRATEPAFTDVSTGFDPQN